MEFKKWLVNETEWLNDMQPKSYGNTVASGVTRTAVGFLPVVGAYSALGEMVVDLFNMRRAGKDIRKIVLKMMDAKDKVPGMPSNIFDLEDNLSQAMSQHAKMQIAAQIMNKIDGWIAQVQQGQVPQE